MSTEKALPDAIAFMEQMHEESITALKERIANKVLIA